MFRTLWCKLFPNWGTEVVAVHYCVDCKAEVVPQSTDNYYYDIWRCPCGHSQRIDSMFRPRWVRILLVRRPKCLST